MQFIVRPVLIARRCWPMDEAQFAATMVCPLCALENNQVMQKTACLARNGFIHCQSCERFAAVYTADGSPLLPVTFAENSRRRLAGELRDLRAILGGCGTLLRLLSLDPRPVEVSFALDKIVLCLPAKGQVERDCSTQNCETLLPDLPPAVARVLSRSSLSRFQLLPTTA